MSFESNVVPLEPQTTGNLAGDTTKTIEDSFDLSVTQPAWRSYINGLIAAEISSFSRYYDRLIQLNPRGEDSGILAHAIDCPNKCIAQSEADIPDCSSEEESRSIVLLNGNINHDHDIEGTLARLKPRLSRTSRVAIVAYNPYLRGAYAAANLLGLRKGEQPSTFVTATDLGNLAKLAGYEVVKIRPVVNFPWKLGRVGAALNKFLSVLPIARWLSLAAVVVLRPLIPSHKKPSLSIVIPARNEKGNIENALKRLECMRGIDIEVIFVEGHSKDQTWEEIQRVIPLYADRYTLQSYKQTGKGKNDAVRLGFSKATKELLTILDADLTMPPELLHRFYDAYVRGHADFINGNRLTYPMEGQAMKFLNHLGNIFFAKALSWVLDMRIGDSLCGTKLVTKRDYDRMTAWRGDFGDFDPFGDFELLFPASILALGVVDVPIRYRDRTYGSTNIRRFYHGWMLLKMTTIGLLRIKVGRGNRDTSRIP